MARAPADVDSIVEKLETGLQDAAEAVFEAGDGTPPRQCTFRINTEAFGSLSERKKRRAAELVRLRDGEVELRTRESIVAGYELTITVLFARSGAGEVLLGCDGTVIQSKRIPGCYRLILQLTGLQRQLVPCHRRLLECAASNDFATWNRWSIELQEGAQLRELDLSGMNLSHFDLCCADLSGSNLTAANLSHCNLSGANLSGCVLDMARLAGADLFRVQLPRRYMGLLTAAGLVEIESAILVD